MNKIDFSKYTKEEIVKGLELLCGNYYLYGNLLRNLQAAIEMEHRNNIHIKASEAMNKSVSAMNALQEWKKQMIAMYGDGKTVKLAAIPYNEIQRGAELETAFKEAEEARKKASKAEDDLYKNL